MPTTERFAFGDFVLERSQRRVLRADGRELALTPRLFNALLLFVEHPGELLDKNTLMQALWPGLVVEENNLNQVISHLRKALGNDAHGHPFIQTVPRYGYRFVGEVVGLPGARPHTSPTPVTPEPSAPQPQSADTSRRPPRPVVGLNRRRMLALGVAGGGAVTVGGAAWWAWRFGEEPPPVRGRVTLAVLPFKPVASTERDKLLEVGMADSLIARLSLIPGLVVVSTGSVSRFAGPVQDPLAAARELGVTWIVDGSLQRDGELLRATARLLSAVDGSAAWSGSFDERSVSLFDIQDQISNRIAQALQSALQHDVDSRWRPVDVGGTRNPEAYQLYLAASWRVQGWGPEDVDTGIRLLDDALVIDPSYAQAWALLAWAHRRRLWRYDADPADVFKAADSALRRALAVAPDLAQARAGIAFRRYLYDFDWQGAEADFRAALKTNPNELSAQWGLAQMLLTQDRIAEGFVHMRRARELNPMSPVLNTIEAGFLISSGRLDEARLRLDRALAIAPAHGLALIAAGLLHMAEHRPELATAALRRAVAVGPDGSRPRAVLAAHLAAQGEATEARAIRDELKTWAAVRFVPPTSIAMVEAALGEVPAALTGIERAVRVRDSRVVYLKDDPSWTVLRTQPRFKAISRALGLDRYGPGLWTV